MLQPHRLMLQVCLTLPPSHPVAHLTSVSTLLLNPLSVKLKLIPVLAHLNTLLQLCSAHLKSGLFYCSAKFMGKPKKYAQWVIATDKLHILSFSLEDSLVIFRK